MTFEVKLLITFVATDPLIILTKFGWNPIKHAGEEANCEKKEERKKSQESNKLGGIPPNLKKSQESNKLGGIPPNLKKSQESNKLGGIPPNLTRNCALAKGAR